MVVKKGYPDLFTRIRNGYLAKLRSIQFPYTKRNLGLLRFLLRQKLIEGWIDVDGSKSIEQFSNIKDLNEGTLFLKYTDGQPVFHRIESVSTSGRRIYLKLYEIKNFVKQNDYQIILVISTNKGLLTQQEALEYRVGGEVLGFIE